MPAFTHAATISAMQTPPSPWLTVTPIVISALALVVSVAVGLIQYYLQRQQHKQNLFDRRFTVYRAVQDYVFHIIETGGRPRDERTLVFDNDTSGVEFLFPSDVSEYVFSIRNAAKRMLAIRRQCQIPINDKDYYKALSDVPDIRQEYCGLMGQMFDQVVGATSIFRRHLKVEDQWRWWERIEISMNLISEHGDRLLAARYAKPH